MSKHDRTASSTFFLWSILIFLLNIVLLCIGKITAFAVVRTFLLLGVSIILMIMFFVRARDERVRAERRAKKQAQRVENEAKAAAAMSEPAKPAAVKAAPTRRTYISPRFLPNMIGDATRQRYYAYDLTLADGIDVYELLDGKERDVTCAVAEGKIIFEYNGSYIGYVENSSAADMLADWVRRGDPYMPVLREPKEGRPRVSITFYKDRRKGAEGRDQEVFVLASCKSAAKQERIDYVSLAEELKICEADDGKSYEVLFDGEPIGKLPGKIAKRYDTEGCYGIFVEDLQEEYKDNGDIVTIPILRIYW